MRPSNVLRVGDWYHLRIQIAGKRITESLDTQSLPEAKRRARARVEELLAAERAGRLGELRAAERAEGPVAGLAEVVARYARAVVLPVGDRARRDNPVALRRVLRVATGNEEIELEAISCAVLSGELAREFQRRWLERVRGLGPAPENSARVSANSILTQARSLFSKRAMKAGVYEGLNLGPGLAGFLGVERLAVARVANYQPPAPEQVEALREAAAKLQSGDVALWLVMMIGLHAGLRRGELVALRWGWVQGDSIVVPATDGVFQAKSKIGRVVPLRPGLLAEVRAVCAAAGQQVGLEDYVLPGGSVGARLEHFRLLGRWMRGLGWKRRQTSHELRKLAASAFAAANNVFAAQAVMGHADLETTRRYVAVGEIKPI